MAYLLRPPKRQRVAPPAQTEPGPEPLWLWQSQGEAPFAPRTVEESDLPETVESDAEELPQIDLPDETKAQKPAAAAAEPTAQIHNPLSCQARVLLPKKLQRNFRTRQRLQAAL